jgi:hypothetical protein
VTPLREAVVLPALFLTVALLGGLRVTGTVHLVPPALDALALALILVGSLARTRVLVPEALMAADRGAVANVCGAVVLLTLFAASAQIFNLLTPGRGLLHAIFAVFFLVQLLTTLAGITSRRPMLRSLMVLFGAAFVLRFIVLEGLYAPQSSLLQRLLTVVLEGVSLGALAYEPHAAITGYVALLTMVLYVAGLILLGFDHGQPAGLVRSRSSALRGRD